MQFAETIPFPKIKELLTNEHVQEIELKIAEKTGLKILPCEWLTSIQRELSAANLDIEVINKILEGEKYNLIAYCLAIDEDEEISRDSNIQEYPEGEEPDEDDKDETIEVLGLGNGAALSYLCTYYCLKYREYQDLKDFLKWRRIPYANKYASQLRRVFKSLFN